MESGVIAVLCPQCGGNNVKMTAVNEGVCENCGAKILLQEEQNTINIVNNVTVLGGDENNSSIIKYATVNNVISTDEFLREIFYNFAVDTKAGESIFDSEFSPVEKKYDKFTSAEGYAELDYSVSVGYNRYVTQKEYNNISKKYETVTKKITDWSPHSGKYSGHYTVGMINGVDGYLGAKKVLEDISKSNPVTIENAIDVDCKPYEITSEEQKNIRKAIFERCENDAKSSLPGNTYKNFSCSGKSKIEKITAYSLPRYTLNYKYEEKEYSFSDKAYGERNSKLQIPQSTEIKAFNKEFLHKYSPLCIVGAVLLFLGILFGLILPSIPVLMAVPVVLGLLTLGGLFFLFIINVTEYMKKNQEKKKVKFVEILRKYKLSDATEEELFAIEKASAKSIKDK